MTTLEKIRDEIEKIAPLDYPCDKRTPEHIRDMAVEIVEKYAEQEPMTLDEAIKHAEEIAESKCDECGAEHRQLAEWLKELRAYKEPCDDVVSRQAVLEIMKQHVLTNDYAAIQELPPVRPQEPIPEQWQELKETITEMRDNDGTGTQQEVCKFLSNYMAVLEKQMVDPTCDTCKYTTATFNPCNACKDKSEFEPQESEDKE